MRPILLAPLYLFVPPALADQLFVPSTEYPTIQMAVDAAADGDEVVLRDGVFTGPGNLDVVMPPTAIVLRSENIGGSVIRGPGDPSAGQIRALVFDSTSSPDIVVRGIIFQECTGARAGGAISITSSSPRFEHCSFIRNSTTDLDGGGIVSGGAIQSLGSPVHFVDCVFQQNTASPIVFHRTGEGEGGAILVRSGSMVLERCVFVRNGAYGAFDIGSARGGAIYAENAFLTIKDCEFRFNSVSGGGASGGALRTSVCEVRCISTDFIDNSANGYDIAAGGAILASRVLSMINCSIIGNRVATDLSDASSGGVGAFGTVELTNVVIANNGVASNSCSTPGSGSYGGGLSVSGSIEATNCVINNNSATCAPGVLVYPDSSFVMLNSILWNGSDGLYVFPSAITDIRFSNILGGHLGEGNIDAEPSFEAGSYHLRPDSPCIDAGNTGLLPADTFDLDGDGDTTEPLPLDAAGLARFVNDPTTPDTGLGFPVVDIGAYEYQPACRVDLDGDGVLTIFDFLAFFNAFDDADPVADFDGDGAITVFDFQAFQSEFDAGCE